MVHSFSSTIKFTKGQRIKCFDEAQAAKNQSIYIVGNKRKKKKKRKKGGGGGKEG